MQKFFIFLISVVLLAGSTPNVAFSAPSTPTPLPIDNTGGGIVDNKDGGKSLATSGLAGITTSIARLINILTIAAGIVFMIMIFFSAYKYSLAQGDPKGLVGAKETLTHAIMGFLVAVGAFTIISIAGGIFGLDDNVTNNPETASRNAIQELMDFFDR